MDDASPGGEVPPRGTPLPRVHSRPRALWTVALGAAVVALVGIGITVVAHRRSAGPMLDPTLLAVAPYEVLDPALALWREGLMDVLSHNLDGAGALRTVAPSVSARHWPGGAHAGSAREMARRTGAGMVVFGILFRTGTDSVRAQASLYDARSGRSMTIERREVVARMDRLTDSLTVALLREVDESGARGGPVARTSSIEALKAFLTGEQLFRRSQWDSARVAYARAVAHDSTFALPLRRLGNVTGWTSGEVDSAAIGYRLRAGALNRGLGPRDSLLVLADSLRAAAAAAPTYQGEWPFTRRLFPTLENAARRYPEDPEMWYVLGEARYHYAFGPLLGVADREILAAFDQAIALDSAFAPAYEHAPELALKLGGPPLARRYIDAYLQRYPADTLRSPAGLLHYMLAPGAARAPVVKSVLDSVSLNVLLLARTATHRWPDSAETALRLSRILAGPPRLTAEASAATRRGRLRRLATHLAFRGRIRDAHNLAADADTALVFQVALTGPPQASVGARIERQMARRSGHPNLAIHWWGVNADTMSLRSFLADTRERRRSRERSAVPPSSVYDTAAAHAYLALARRDTAQALRLFTRLPDTLCVTCYPDRLTRARLEAAVGRDREALRDLSERLVGWESPFDVLFALERGRVAERLGDTDEAGKAYTFVADAWRFGDPEVQPYVAEARRGLVRTARRRP